MMSLARLERSYVAIATLCLLLGGCTSAPVREAEAALHDSKAASPLNLTVSPKGGLGIWMLNVGQGSCVYVECPDGKNAILIDCGTSAIGSSSAASITSWLNEKISERTNTTVLVSHGDVDHYSLISGTDGIDATQISKVWIGGLFNDFNEIFRKWTGTIAGKHGLFKSGEFQSDDTRFQCGSARVDLLAVNTSRISTDTPGSRKNADSAVVRISLAGHSIILPGDAEGMTEIAAIENAKMLGIDMKKSSLLVGSHHGSATHGSNSAIWADAVTPLAVAFSADVNYKHHHPRCGPVGRLVQQAGAAEGEHNIACANGATVTKWKSNSKLFSTLENGHILVQIKSGKVLYFCEKMSAACDGALDSEDLP